MRWRGASKRISRWGALAIRLFMLVICINSLFNAGYYLGAYFGFWTVTRMPDYLDIAIAQLAFAWVTWTLWKD